MSKRHTSPKEYEILTAEISRAAFGLTPNQYKKLKGLKRENLRDHMTDLELIFSMLGEASTTQITRVEHPDGFDENKRVSQRGGNVAGVARKKLEKETRRKVISRENYLVSLIFPISSIASFFHSFSPSFSLFDHWVVPSSLNS